MIDRGHFDCVFNHPDGVFGWWTCVSERRRLQSDCPADKDGISDNTHTHTASFLILIRVSLWTSEAETTRTLPQTLLHTPVRTVAVVAWPQKQARMGFDGSLVSDIWGFRRSWHFHPFSPRTGVINVIKPRLCSRSGVHWETAEGDWCWLEPHCGTPERPWRPCRHLFAAKSRETDGTRLPLGL